MDFNSFKQAVIAQANAMGITEYELYYQAVESITASAFGHEINNFSASGEGGVCFRCIVNGKMGYAATEALTQEQAISVVKHAYDNASVLEAEEPVFLACGGQTYAQIQRDMPSMPGTEQLLNTVCNTQETLYAAHPSVVDGSTTRGIAEKSTIAICNSKGLDLHLQNNINALILGAVVADGTEKANDYQIKVGNLETIFIIKTDISTIVVIVLMCHNPRGDNGLLCGTSRF